MSPARRLQPYGSAAFDLVADIQLANRLVNSELRLFAWRRLKIEPQGHLLGRDAVANLAALEVSWQGSGHPCRPVIGSRGYM